MSKLGLLLDVVDIGISVSNYNQLQQMRGSQDAAAKVHAIIQLAREMAFKFNQETKEILGLEAINPKMAAARMNLLELYLQDMGLSPELFLELSDKEYMASTATTIRNNRARLWQMLAPGEQHEVHQAVDAVLNQPDYAYYLEHYDLVQNYRHELPIYERLKAYNSGCLLLILICISPIVLSFVFRIIPTILAIMFQSSFFGTIANVLTCVGFLIGIIAPIIWFTQFAQSKAYGAAKKVVDEAKAKVDMERYTKLEQRLGTDKNAVAQVHQQLNNTIAQFFVDTPPALLSGTTF